MKANVSSIASACLVLTATAWVAAGWAQVAGGTTIVDTSITASTELAMGWSVKKTLLGKSIYNEAGQEVGKIEDLIIAPDRNVSYVIVGAGGFIGIGRHEVAIPVGQIQGRGDRLVMPGATPAMFQAMPEFAYATDTSQRDRFVAAADKDITEGKAKVADLEKRGSTAGAEAKARIDQQITGLRVDLKSAEVKLTELKQATAVRWKEFEAAVNAATSRVRKSIDTATG
jgi:sporulation protein YlmC with PRC-barrel domain